MNFRTAVIATTFLLAASALVGCTPTAEPARSDDSPSETPKPTVTQEQEVQLPEDAVLGITMRATADTGAQVDIALVLHKPAAVSSAEGAPLAGATLAWCDGELDEGVITAESGYSFAQLDVTVEPVEGSAAWPSDLDLHVLPGGGGPTITPGAGAYAVQRPSDSGEDDPGYYVPHCLQDAFVPAPGTGSVYLGWGNDGSSLAAWASSNYGATFDLFGEPVGTPRATLSDCAKVITDLGASMGGSDASLPDYFSETECRVGSAA